MCLMGILGGLDPFSDAVFVFRAKRADRIKIVWWVTHGSRHWFIAILPR